MTSVLPPTVTEDGLAAALDELRGALGTDAVLTAEEDLLEFRDPYWYPGWDDFEASAVVQPGSVEEIQAVLFMDLCAQAYDFNDHASRRFGEELKDLLDQNGILMPGKQGIRPKALRPARGA